MTYLQAGANLAGPLCQTACAPHGWRAEKPQEGFAKFLALIFAECQQHLGVFPKGSLTRVPAGAGFLLPERGCEVLGLPFAVDHRDPKKRGGSHHGDLVAIRHNGC